MTEESEQGWTEQQTDGPLVTEGGGDYEPDEPDEAEDSAAEEPGDPGREA